jgi:hypothetical protein
VQDLLATSKAVPPPALLALLSAGEGQSRQAAPDPTPPAPASANAQGGLAGVRKAAEPISTSSHGDGSSSPVPLGNPVVSAPVGSGAGDSVGLMEQVADLGTVGEKAPASEGFGNTAAVSTHAGPEADPYHLAAGSGSA